jgi:hypothetical protein
VVHQDLATVLRCHTAAFQALGGAPRELLYDRMKTVVTGEGDTGGIIYNRSLIDLARHYGFHPRACQAYRAKTKGKVERPFRYIREDFFLARTFRNLDDLNEQLRRWLDMVANPRVHATTRRVVNEAFAEERAHLRQLQLARMLPDKLHPIAMCYAVCKCPPTWKVSFGSYHGRGGFRLSFIFCIG